VVDDVEMLVQPATQLFTLWTDIVSEEGVFQRALRWPCPRCPGRPLAGLKWRSPWLVAEAVAGEGFVICKAGKPLVQVTPTHGR
jgi:hypothetical protein